MCGLCGEFRFDGSPVQEQTIGAMRDSMLHRGPDSSGVYLTPEGTMGLGFRRLKIVDVSSAGDQPMSNEDGTVFVVFNGEIYNFQALRRQLSARGHVFRSKTDTEVIVHAYEEYGVDAISQLDGMFATAIWDAPRNRVILARDRSGEKPLFYHLTESHIAFASEMKAFFGHGDIPVDIDRAALPHYFLHGYVPSPNTFYRGIKQILPGTVATITREGKMSVRRYWQLQYPVRRSTAPSNPQVMRQRVRELLTAAVSRRMVADVPLGAFLSGGLDSTIVVGLMSRMSDRPVRTFSIGFKDSPAYDETRYATMAANRFETDHTEFIVEPGAFDLVEKLVWHHDGPFADSSAVPTFLVAQLTKTQVTVVLTGDGGDELFAGYSRFYAALTAEALPSVARHALSTLSRHLRPGSNARGLRTRAHRFAAAASLPLDARLATWAGVFHDDVKELLGTALRPYLAEANRLQSFRHYADDMANASTLSKLLYVNFNTYLPDDLLVKTDRCTMANSLEARAPFLDTELMEYVAMLPDSTKLSRGRTKVILREAFADIVPDEILRRSKMGFGIPFGQWFRGSLRDPLHDLLMSPDARYSEFLCAAHVRRLVARHEAGEADLGQQLWTLICFETWLRALPGWKQSTYQRCV